MHKTAESFTLTISFAKCLFNLGAASEFALWKVNFFVVVVLLFDKTAGDYYITYPFLGASLIPFVQLGAVLNESHSSERGGKRSFVHFSPVHDHCDFCCYSTILDL